MELELPETFAAVLEDAGREPLPGAAPVIALAPDDPADQVQQLLDAGARTVELRRRGIDHGRWAELGEDIELPLPRPSQLRLRWRQARPFVVRGALTEELRLDRNAIHGGLTLHADLQAPEGLERLLRSRLGTRGARFTVGEARSARADPERDVATHEIRDANAGYADLWAKVGRLSTHAQDRSLRLRFSFGAEVDDDDSRDEGRHRAVAALTRDVLPEAGLAGPRSPLVEHVSEWCGVPLYATQGIAYWNAPEGGARFHHDAFGPDDESGGQRGVLYVQLAGSTAWLALSIADLARRVAEFAQGVEPEQRAELVGDLDPEDLASLREELAQPGCGRLGALVDEDARFTAFLADCGHAALLGPGDAIVLPNRGRGATAMHSVLCADTKPTYALSFGLREVRGRGGKGKGRRARKD